MYRALRGTGHRAVTVLYLARTLAEAAFAEEFATGVDPDGDVRVHLSAEDGRLDLWPWLADPDDDARVYCCGGTALMDDVRALTDHLVESGRWTEERALLLVDDVAATGPLAPVV